MKGLSTLIKLHKRTLDELRRKITSLENQKAQLLLLSDKLLDELSRENKMATKQLEMARFFGDFAKRIKNRREELAREVASLDKQIASLGEEVAIAYGEVKKFEIAQANIEKREKQKQNRKETIMLDEIAGQQHRRKPVES